MQTKGLLAVVAAVIIAGGAYMFTQQDSAGGSGDQSGSGLSTHIPADSMLFFLNETPIPTSLMVTSDASYEQMALLADSVVDGGAPAGAVFWATLGSKYLRSIQLGEDGLKDDWGFGDKVSTAMYFVGIFPVLELSLANPGKLVAQVKAAAEASGLTVQTKSAGAATEHRIEFFSDEDQSFSMLVRETAGWARIAIESPVSADLASLVSGEVLPEQSVASAGILQKIKSSVSVRNDFVASFNFLELAKIFTDENSLAGKMLTELVPEADFRDAQTPECKAEINDIVAGMPEWVFASEIQPAANNKTLKAKTESLLRITHPDIANELVKLNGVLPDFSNVKNFNPLYSFSLGLDVSKLTPVVMSLHQRFMAKEFKCQKLVEAQLGMAESNPAMLGMATAMVAGIKGASITINNIDVPDASMQFNNASAVVSVSAASARQILSMVQGFSPDLASLVIPEDGSPVDFQSMMLPPMAPELQIAIKDDHHIVLMTKDAEAVAVSESFSGLALTPKGFIGMSVNAEKISKLMSAAPESDNPMMGMIDAEACATMAMMQSTYSANKLVVDWQSRFGDKGFVSDIYLQQNLVTASDVQVQPGQYQSYRIDAGCKEVLNGTETIKADGSGLMQARDAESTCDAFSSESEYKWQQTGRSLSLVHTKSRERSTSECDSAWNTWQPVESDGGAAEVCVLLSADDKGFECIFDINEEPSLYRFKRL